jgi:hypothetical protein
MSCRTVVDQPKGERRLRRRFPRQRRLHFSCRDCLPAKYHQGPSPDPYKAFLPGACVAELSRRHDVSTSLISTWRGKLREGYADAGCSLTNGPRFAEAVMLAGDGERHFHIAPAIVVDLGRSKHLVPVRTMHRCMPQAQQRSQKRPRYDHTTSRNRPTGIRRTFVTVARAPRVWR